MPVGSATLSLAVVLVSGCATPAPTSRMQRSAGAALQVDFTIADGHLDQQGHMVGSLLVHVISGTAKVHPNVDPFLTIADDFRDCVNGKKVIVVAVDSVIMGSQPSPFAVDAGSWYGQDFQDLLIPPGDPVPGCVEGMVAVAAQGMARPGERIVVRKVVRLEKMRR